MPSYYLLNSIVNYLYVISYTSKITHTFNKIYYTIHTIHYSIILYYLQYYIILFVIRLSQTMECYNLNSYISCNTNKNILYVVLQILLANTQTICYCTACNQFHAYEMVFIKYFLYCFTQAKFTIDGYILLQRFCLILNIYLANG